MNNLEQTNGLADLVPRPTTLSQSLRVRRQLQPDEGSFNLSAEGVLATQRYVHPKNDDARDVFLVVQTSVPQTKFGLLDSLSGQLTISRHIPSEYPKNQLNRTDSSGYLKNGILVHHAGQNITSRDVDDALAEE